MSNSENPMLSVVIVNWNTRALLERCLDLIPGSAGSLSYEVIVVDNGSGDGSREMMGSRFPEVRLIANAENRGFAVAVNQGIAQSQGDYIALVNTDIMMSPEVLAKLVNELAESSELGAVGPQLVGSEGEPQQSGGFAPSPLTVMKQFAGTPRLQGKSGRGIGVWSMSDEPMRVDWLCGALMVVRRKALDQVGTLDESYFMYAEDMEFGLRLKAAGWYSDLLPAIKVEHLRGASGAVKIPEMKLMWLAGIFRVASVHLGRFSYAAFGLLMALDFFSKSAAAAISAWSRSRKTGERARATSGDLRLFAMTSLNLALRRPGFASDLYQRLGEAGRKKLNQAP
ncbi:MAG: glycosyltransferase family 2 protein [Thermoleophilia bacterium]